MGSNPAPNTIFYQQFSSFIVFFSNLRWYWVKSKPMHPHSSLFIILIILNIVQYLYVLSTTTSILCVHPPYPTSPPTPNLATNQPLPPTGPHQRFFFHFHNKFNSSFTSTLPPPNRTPTPNPTTPPPPPPPEWTPTRPFLHFHNNFNSSFTSTLPPGPLAFSQ